MNIFSLDRIPIRFRLSLAHALWTSLLFVVVALSLYKIVEKNLYDSVDTALLSSARALRDAHFSIESQLIRDDYLLGDAIFQGFFNDPWHFDLPFTYKQKAVRPFAQIIHVSGKVQSKTENVTVNLPVTPRALERAEQGLFTFETFEFPERPPLRQITLSVMGLHGFTGELVQVGASLMHTHDTLKGIALILWFILPFVLMISIFLGYALTARSLKPVRQITRAANQLGIHDMGIRLPLPTAHDELRELSCTFNAMLDRLEDAVKRLRRFTGDVSHELRTPLAVVRAEAELALRKDRAPADYVKSLQAISKESFHMSEIIEDLLLLARAESKSVAMHWVEVEASNFAKELTETVAKFYEQRHVEIRVEVRISSFLCAPGYLSLALKNILLNAAKHSQKGGVVFFQVDRSPTEITFSVEDRGDGIPKEDLPYIFDPFFRSDTARNRSAGGVGIGLSLALALIKLHNGKIDVKSEREKGTVFQVSIPTQV